MAYFENPNAIPVSFYFSLSFDSTISGPDCAFMEAAGIQVETAIEEVTCGGENRFAYKLPKANKYPNLVLKRGLVPKNSALTQWCYEVLSNGLAKPVATKNIGLKLLDAKGNPLITWSFTRAYPIKWSVSDFNSMENKLSVESLEFAYLYLNRHDA